MSYRVRAFIKGVAPKDGIIDLDEYDIRQWFKEADLARACDTLNVCEKIYEERVREQPRRVSRKRPQKR